MYLLCFGLLALTSFWSVFAHPEGYGGGSYSANPLQKVSLRVEGLVLTVFEDVVYSRGHNVTATLSGRTNHCDGTNNQQSTTPGNTPTATLDTAASLPNSFYWDGYTGFFDDFFITQIGPDKNDTDQRGNRRDWGILVNYQFIDVGGCQFKTQKDDKILFAFDAFNAKYFLKLDGPKLAKRGQPFTLSVTDGRTGKPFNGAFVESSSGTTVITDPLGHAQFSFQQSGTFSFKASGGEAIRSNRWTVKVV
ncbi:MAG: hypothetical protein M1816_007698 [Peltula sp. TS41687]|nr:MAG: hypothetical protein M1816_007698 [Peltula sp. TS41687]